MHWKSFNKSFENYLKLERGLSENSISAYLQDVAKLKQFIDFTKKEISPKQVQTDDIQEFLQWVNELGMSPFTQARVLSGIKSFFKFLILEDLIEENPTEIIEAPKLARKLPDVLSISEIEQLFENIDHSTPEGTRNRAILEVLYSSGLRVSELIGLRMSNIFRDLGFIKIIGKGNKERFVPIGKMALKQTDIYINEVRNHVNIKKGNEDFVFLNRRGSALSRVFIFMIIKELVAKSGIHKTISPHTFRHSFATHLIEGGADLRVIQEMLGHESITTTEIYTHLDRDYLRQTVMMYHPRS